jgi:hypothetical protein
VADSPNKPTRGNVLTSLTSLTRLPVGMCLAKPKSANLGAHAVVRVIRFVRVIVRAIRFVRVIVRVIEIVRLGH